MNYEIIPYLILAGFTSFFLLGMSFWVIIDDMFDIAISTIEG